MSLKKSVSLAMASAAILGVGIARAQVDMSIETEQGRRERDPRYGDPLGLDLLLADAALAGRVTEHLARRTDVIEQDLEQQMLSAIVRTGEVITKTDAAGNKVVLDIETWDPKSHPFSAPFDQSHAFKSLGDIYAQAAAAIMKPGDDEPMPDRFSVNPDSPHYDKRWASIRIGVRFDGSDRPGDVEEYCISEGWIRVQTFMKNGKVKRERGKVVCLKRYGVVEPYRK